MKQEVIMFGRKKDAIEELESYLCRDMKELLKQIRNRCDYLLTVDDDTLHPETLIEDIFEDAQELVDYCVEDELD